MSPRAILLLTGHRHFITADNAEDAYIRIAAVAGEPLDPTQFHDAVAAALREGLIADPIQLAPNSLQCHWRLMLTPAGVAAARALTGE